MEGVDQLVVLQDFIRIGVSGNDVVGPSLCDIGELLGGDFVPGERLRLKPVAGGIDVGGIVKSAVQAPDVQECGILAADNSCCPVVLDVFREL